jgi:hypothetical protein
MFTNGAVFFWKGGRYNGEMEMMNEGGSSRVKCILDYYGRSGLVPWNDLYVVLQRR